MSDPNSNSDLTRRDLIVVALAAASVAASGTAPGANAKPEKDAGDTSKALPFQLAF